MNKVAGFFTELMRRYLPDPFVFAIGLTLLSMVMAMLVEGQGASAVIMTHTRRFIGTFLVQIRRAISTAAARKHRVVPS